jgi:hypothetical protein
MAGYSRKGTAARLHWFPGSGLWLSVLIDSLFVRLGLGRSVEQTCFGGLERIDRFSWRGAGRGALPNRGPDA